MALVQKDYEQLTTYIKDHIMEWFPRENIGGISVYDLEIRERIVRVEEELKNQRELMQKGFDFMEKRFEQVDKRFEHIYSFMKWQTGLGFAALAGIYIKLFLG